MSRRKRKSLHKRSRQRQQTTRHSIAAEPLMAGFPTRAIDNNIHLLIPLTLRILLVLLINRLLLKKVSITVGFGVVRIEYRGEIDYGPSLTDPFVPRIEPKLPQVLPRVRSSGESSVCLW